MITKEEIQELLHTTETFRVERTVSTGDMDKFQEAICAFANDLPNSRKKGYLIIGAYDNGELSGLKVTDDLLKKVATQSPKVASPEVKVAGSDQKVASSSPKVASLRKKASSEEMAIYILEFCATWRSMDEIAQFANRDKNYIRNKVLPRLSEKLEKEYPDVPNHPRQRYKAKQKDNKKEGEE